MCLLLSERERGEEREKLSPSERVNLTLHLNTCSHPSPDWAMWHVVAHWMVDQGTLVQESPWCASTYHPLDHINAPDWLRF